MKKMMFLTFLNIALIALNIITLVLVNIKIEKPAKPKPAIIIEKPAKPKPAIIIEKPAKPKPAIIIEKPAKPEPDEPDISDISIINEFVKSLPRGWTAEEMKAKLEAKFGEKIAVKIIEKDGARFVILTIPGDTREWWCTYKGLQPWGDK